MKGYLIYKKEDAARNQMFIRFFYEEGTALGVHFEYVPYEEYTQRELPDFVLNRTRDAFVSRWYEKQGVVVLHSSLVTEIGNHKMKMLSYLQKTLPKEVLAQKWAPESCLLAKEQLGRWIEAAAARDYAAFGQAHPFWQSGRTCILKTVDGHGGSEVAELFTPLGSPDDRAWKWLEKTLQPFWEKECILQEKIPSDSKDVRVYILGNQIYQGVLRQGTKDFRSNFSLGGTAAEYPLSERERAFVEKFLFALQTETLGLAGLDFIVDREGKLIFNEMEEMVGSRMLYQISKHNVVRDYVIWLKQIMEKNGCR